MSGPGVRLESLTALRWFAALAVFACHARELTASTPSSLAEMCADGGVTFFFVLSGFVLAWSWRPGTPVGTFYRRRFARVWPLLALGTLLAVPALGEAWSTAWPGVVRNLLLLEAWLPGGPPAGNPVSWSLSCEAYFYALFPLLAACGLRLSRRSLAAVAVAAVAVAWVYRWLAFHLLEPMPTPVLVLVLRLPAYRITAFVLGVAAALAMRRGWRPRCGAPTALGLIACTLAAVWSGRVLGWWGHWWSDQALAPGFALLIAAVAAGELRGRPQLGLRRRPFVLLGQWSFAFYLVHYPLLHLTARSLGIGPYGEAGYGLWPSALLWLCWLAAGTALAALCHHAVERPAERLIRGR
ncbi:acyltransferase [Kitasatospora albolonga]